MRKSSFFVLSALLLSVLAACSPRYNWREYHDADAHFSVLFPDKPATAQRMVNLDGLPVLMTMTAAEVDGTTFAVGTAELPRADAAATALQAMKTALVNNIHGNITKTASSSSKENLRLDVDAHGRSTAGTPLLLSGHFVARDRYVYQVIVIGKEKKLARENIDMFLGAFRLD